MLGLIDIKIKIFIVDQMQKVTQLVTFHLVTNIKPTPSNKFLLSFICLLVLNTLLQGNGRRQINQQPQRPGPKILWQRLGHKLAHCLELNYIHATGFSGLPHMAYYIFLH